MGVAHATQWQRSPPLTYQTGPDLQRNYPKITQSEVHALSRMATNLGILVGYVSISSTRISLRRLQRQQERAVTRTDVGTPEPTAENKPRET
jgi:hypothetical protein